MRVARGTLSWIEGHWCGRSSEKFFHTLLAKKWAYNRRVLEINKEILDYSRTGAQQAETPQGLA
jgi:hypothetical protein